VALEEEGEHRPEVRAVLTEQITLGIHGREPRRTEEQVPITKREVEGSRQGQNGGTAGVGAARLEEAHVAGGEVRPGSQSLLGDVSLPAAFSQDLSECRPLTLPGHRVPLHMVAVSVLQRDGVEIVSSGPLPPG